MYAVKQYEKSNRILIPNELQKEWLESYTKRLIDIELALGDAGIYWLVDFDTNTIFVSPLNKIEIDKTADENGCSPLDICMDIMRENNEAEQMLLSYYKIANRK